MMKLRKSSYLVILFLPRPRFSDLVYKDRSPKVKQQVKAKNYVCSQVLYDYCLSISNKIIIH